MSAFDSPVSRCNAVREFVLTDETQAECAHEHKCPADRTCPLDGYFVDEEALRQRMEEALQTH